MVDENYNEAQDSNFKTDLDQAERRDTDLRGPEIESARQSALDTDFEHTPEDFSLVDLSRPEQEIPLDPAAIEDLYISRDDLTDQLDDFSDDPDILDDFADRQGLATGRDELLERLHEHHSKTPRLSGGDIDARWEDSDVSGEESVGASAPTPDQDRVDELGAAFGLHYDDDEELRTFDKFNERDLNRWELDPASAEEDDDERLADEW